MPENRFAHYFIELFQPARNLIIGETLFDAFEHRMTDQAEQIYERLLVVRAQAGDAAAFDELVQRYSPRLRYFLRKLLVSSDGAEDALQDVWLDVFRHLPRLSNPQALVAWIYRVARDRAFARLRKSGRFEQLLDDGAVVDDSQERSFSAEDARRIHAALDRLAPEHREVLVLRFLEEMSYEQISRVVGCQLGTVRSRLHYAKLALRKAMIQP